MAAEPAEPRRTPLQPGEPAPDFVLAAAHGEGRVSLAEYRGRSPVLLGIFRGPYCPFCRRALARMGQVGDRLRAEGVEPLAVVGTSAENARLYFRFRPPRMAVAADPDFATHRRYGVPAPRRSDIEEALRTTRVNPDGELPEPLPIRHASAAFNRRDGYELTPTDREDAGRPFLQFYAQFLVDRDGIVRWTNLEAGGDDLAGLGQFPSDAELLDAVRTRLR